MPNLIMGREYRSKQIEAIHEKYRDKRNHVVGFKESHTFTNEQIQLLDQLRNEEEKELGAVFADATRRVLTSETTQPALDDAWKLYLGMPQSHDTFGISDYKPSQGKEDIYYFKLNNFWQSLTKDFGSLKNVVDALNSNGGAAVFEGTFTLPNDLDDPKRESDVMDHYKITLGHDEKGSYIAYFDEWDIASAFSQNIIAKGVGKPMQIYDRKYYNPLTFEPIE